jgi:hypothetical protein
VTSPSNNIKYNTAISPTSATTGSSVSFTYTITRESSSSNLGWASIQVPAGFTITGTPTATDSNPPGGTWVATVAGNTITVHASGTSSELTTNGQYVRVTFTATVPTTEGTYGPFTSTVYQHYDKSGYGPGTLDGNDPTVKIYKAGVLDHFTITGYPSSRTAGQNFGSNNVVITVYDGGNNILTGYTGQIYFTSTDNQAVLPYTPGSKYTFVSGDNGVHTFAGTGFTLNTAGSQTITITDGSVSATSNSITVNPAAASKLVFTVGASQTLNVDAVSSVITVQRQDQYGNPVTSGTTSVTLTSSSLNGEFYSDPSGDNAYIITSRTISSGSTANFYYRDYTAGTPTLTASATGFISATSQFTITGQSDEPRYSTSISTTPAQVLTGSPASFTITVTMQSIYDVDISKVIITIPPEFNGIAITSVTTNNGGNWASSLAGNVITLTSGGIYDDLEEDSHDAVTVRFTATPQTAGTYTFVTSVYGHLAADPIENFNLGPGSNTGTDPSVTVYTTVTITSSTTGSGFVVVDGNAITTPTTFVWAPGSTYTLQANSLVSGGTGTQYVWTSWSDGGAMTHTYTVPSTSTTVTANYLTQYQVTVTASPSAAIGGTFSVTYTKSGTTYTNEQHTTTWTSWTDASTTVTVSNPQSTYNGYDFSSYTNNQATMNSAQTITLNYHNPLVTLALDGSNTNSDYSSSIQVTLSTTQPNDLIYVSAVISTQQSFNYITSNPSLTWATRTTVTYGGDRMQTWYAIMPSSGSITITINLNGGSTHWAVAAFAVAGADIASPFDGTAHTNTGSSGSASASITTSNANDFIIGVLGVQGNTPALTTGNGYTLVTTGVHSGARETSIEYQIASATGTYTPGYTFSSNDWGMIADAIKSA